LVAIGKDILLNQPKFLFIVDIKLSRCNCNCKTYNAVFDAGQIMDDEEFEEEIAARIE
jgi:hypothetical protein